MCSPIYDVTVKRWDANSDLNAMVLGSHTAIESLHIVRTDSKRHARLNLLPAVLSGLQYAGRSKRLMAPDLNGALEFTPDCVTTHRLPR